MRALPSLERSRSTNLTPLVGAFAPTLFFGWWWLLITPVVYWFLRRLLMLLPSEASLTQSKEREREALFFLSALGGSLKAGLPLLPALANVAALLTSSLKGDIERVYSLLLLGAQPSQAWGAIMSDKQLGIFARSIARAQIEGRSLATVVDRVTTESFERSMAHSKEGVKSLSVKLALPVGLCFLPSFLIGGIGPVIYSFFTSLRIF
jgi:pilus assembly protein TadC